MFDRGKLREYMKANKLRQREIARTIGMTESTLSMILTGQRKCSLDTYVQICTLLGVPIGEFIRATDRPARIDDFRAPSEQSEGDLPHGTQ